MNLRRLRVAFVAALSTLIPCCGSVRRGEPIAGPMAYESPAVAHGAEVFSMNCGKCHPGGEGGLGPSLNDKPLPVFLMKTQVRAGLGAMPSFDCEQIDDDDLDDLTSYVVALRHHGE